MYEMIKKDKGSHTVQMQRRSGNKKSQTDSFRQIVPVIQLQPETLREKVKRALIRVNLHYMPGRDPGPDYKEGDTYGRMFNDSDIEYLAKKLESNCHPRIHGKRLELILDSLGRVRTRKVFGSGEGMLGRVSKENLDYAIDMMLVDRAPDRAEWVHTVTKQIQSLQELISVGDRLGLPKVMGMSAFALTGIENAEYLHIIGHQLGGEDEPENLCAGSHALNTAMIPIENLVRKFQGERRRGSYKVEFYIGQMRNARTGRLFNWVYTVRITLTLKNGQDPDYVHVVTIKEPSDIESYIQQKQIQEIKRDVRNFEASLS